MSVVVFANSITSGVSASAFDFIQIGSQIILPNQTVFVIAAVQSIQAFKGGVPTTFLAEALVAPVPTTPLTIQGPLVDGQLSIIRVRGGTFSADFGHLGGV